MKDLGKKAMAKVKEMGLAPMRNLLLTRLHTQIKTNYPIFKEQKIEEIVFVMKEKKQGVYEGKMGVKIASKEMDWCELVQDEIERLLELVPNKGSNATQAIVSLNYVKKRIEGNYKERGQNELTNFSI